ILTPSGYIKNDTVYSYVKDYQGNIRRVVRQDGAVVESTDYYPYGTPFTTANSVQPYKYGTKELDRMHGLDLYDSQARWYDSLLGRTSTLDPKAEKYYSLSPYTWCAGNPVKFVDPDGKEYGDTLASQDAAAIDFGNCYNGISILQNLEYSTIIYSFAMPNGQTAYSYTMPQKGTSNTGGDPILPQNGETIVAQAHTHAAYDINYYNNEFSGETNSAEGNLHANHGDILAFIINNLDGYVSTPNGSLRKYDCNTGVVTIISTRMPSDIRDKSSPLYEILVLMLKQTKNFNNHK
ncbi:MAG: DUF4329 domain-containing protein, partial [bacterium]|nr:DUF4329 domain-containing protein [bacterium]